jgi:hypothetical protein
MNRTSISPDIVASPPLHRAQVSCACISLGSTTPLDQGDISGDLTDFSSINGVFLAAKETEKGNESLVDLTRNCCKSPVTMNTVLIRV